MAEASRGTKRIKPCYWVLSLVLLSSLAFGLALLTRGHDWGGDFAGYVMQAQSIARGDLQGFIERNAFAVDQSSDVFGPVAYPWGYPLLLTPLVLVFGSSLLPFKLLGLAFFIGSLAVAFLLFEPRLKCTDAVMLVAVLAFSPMFLRFTDKVLSDLPFLFFSTTTLVVLDRAVVLPKRLSPSFRVSILLGFLIFVTSFVRTTGLLLVPTLLMVQGVAYVRRRRSSRGRQGRILLSAAVPHAVFAGLLLVSWGVFPQGGTSHVQFLTLNGHVLLHNIRYYAELPSGLFAVYPLRQSALLVYGMCVPFLIAGMIRRARRDYHLIAYGAATLVTYLFWPYVQGARFLFPVLPFFIYFVFEGMRESRFGLGGANPRLGMVLTYAFWALFLGLSLAESTRAAAANLGADRAKAGPFDSSSREMFDYVATQTKSQDVIGFFKPRVMRMMTDRDALLVREAETLCLTRYYVHSKEVPEGSVEIPAEQLEVQGRLGRLRQVWENDGFTVYRTTGCVGEPGEDPVRQPTPLRSATQT